LRQTYSIVIFCDNVLTIKLSKNPVMHGHNKHIDIQFSSRSHQRWDSGAVALFYLRADCRHHNKAAKAWSISEVARFNRCLWITRNKLKINDIHFKGGCWSCQDSSS
jgi:5-keto 4-deoxyuronate isomerase